MLIALRFDQRYFNPTNWFHATTTVCLHLIMADATTTTFLSPY